MNIGIVTMWFERGAGYVSRQYRQILNQKNKVFIYARSGKYLKGDPFWDDSNITWGKYSNLPVPTAIDRLDFEAWIKQRKIDIVFFNEQQWWEPLDWCLHLGIKTGAYIDYYTEETIPFFAAYDFLICNTQRHYAAFSWHPQVFYVPWGTDIDLFKPQNFKPVDSKKIVFFHSCGYSPQRKGTDFIIQAFNNISNPSKLIIHSQVDLLREIPEQKNIIQALEQKDLLKIINKTVSAPGLYHLGDVYVNASRLEGLGLPSIESQACGLPLITCDHPPMNEFMIEETGRAANIERLWSRKDGYYWPQCSPEINSLTAILNSYIENFSCISDLKRLTRFHAEQRFNWMDRFDLVNSIFETSTVDAPRKKDAVKQALLFERDRQGIVYRLAKNYPLAWNIYSSWRYKKGNFSR
ncbi:glycosyltransferase [Pseudanabaena sp. 'Roaring Creek']|uniref:glycosyltransferase n=1 Tax=Pseudanabaena sp. 'Roaring Creek' TaxID=1681830 RepID=UPI0006D7E0C0|nr:glycosyltransferase [Pseudanabaena sp. 'Roaring Creek']